LGRRMLIENPSRYIDLPDCPWPEAAFLKELTKRTGCGLLFDVNNLFISAHNLRFDLGAYLWDLPMEAIGQFHVAGHSQRTLPMPGGGEDLLLIDDHGSAVSADVWHVLETMLGLSGPRPVLVEWDNQVPPLADLLAEAAKAQQILDVTVAQLVREPNHAA